MDAITLIKKDHRTVEALFKRFEKLGDKATSEKKEIVREIVKELSIHAAIEEALFYPTVRRATGDDDDVFEALEEHHVLKLLLAELETARPSSERYDAKVTVLKENVMHHVEEEEGPGGLLAKLQKKLDRQELADLGRALEMAKQAAPTRPHPSAPDTPPANLLANVPAALMDKVRDLIAMGVQKAANGSKSRTRSTMTSRHMAHRMGRAPQSAPKKRATGGGGRKAKRASAR